MSDERPSAAQALYGEEGPISDGPGGRAREVVDAGIARPDPRFVDDRAPPPRQEARSGPAFDSARYRPTDSSSPIDPGLMGEFSGVAQELNLDQRGGERLLEMHSRAVKASEEAYARRLADNVDRLERELPAEHLRAARELINDENYTPREMREWLGTWGNHPAVAQMLVRWAAAIRNGRY
jgi:hypothetical protein